MGMSLMQILLIASDVRVPEINITGQLISPSVFVFLFICVSICGGRLDEMLVVNCSGFTVG